MDGTLFWKFVNEKDEVVLIKGALQVKSSRRATANDVRALKGVIGDGKQYKMGVIVSLYESNSAEIKRICRDFAEPMSTYHTGQAYPKLQVYSIEAYFAGQAIQAPVRFRPYKSAEFRKYNIQKTTLY